MSCGKGGGNKSNKSLIERYIDALKYLSDSGINPGSIALAGCHTKTTIERLGLNDDDMEMLKTLLAR